MCSLCFSAALYQLNVLCNLVISFSMVVIEQIDLNIPFSSTIL